MKSDLVERFKSGWTPDPFSGCWLWFKCCGTTGYGRIRVLGKTMQAHRLSWEIYNEKPPEDIDVLHKCDTPCCVNPNHLFLGTDSDNLRDMYSKHRRTQRGVANGNNKLTENDVQ